MSGTSEMAFGKCGDHNRVRTERTPVLFYTPRRVSWGVGRGGGEEQGDLDVSSVEEIIL